MSPCVCVFSMRTQSITVCFCVWHGDTKHHCVFVCSARGGGGVEVSLSVCVEVSSCVCVEVSSCVYVEVSLCVCVFSRRTRRWRC